jgi:hypothetical protein
LNRIELEHQQAVNADQAKHLASMDFDRLERIRHLIGLEQLTEKLSSSVTNKIRLRARNTPFDARKYDRGHRSRKPTQPAKSWTSPFGPTGELQDGLFAAGIV